MLTEERTLELLDRSSFRIFIETTYEEGETIHWYGTGFFVTDCGFALTAFHNLPKQVWQAGGGKLRVYYRKLTNPIELKWRPDLSQKDVDIAVLQLEKPDTVNFDHVPMAYVPWKLPAEERKQVWRSLNEDQQLSLFGYPVRAVQEGRQTVTTQAGHPVMGTLADDVWRTQSEIDPLTEQQESVERMCINAVKCDELPGISGGAVLDRRTGWVIGVEGSFDGRRSHCIYASELARLVEETWKPVGETRLLDSLRRLDLYLGDGDEGPGEPDPDKTDKHLLANLRKSLEALRGMMIAHEGREMAVLDYLRVRLSCRAASKRNLESQLVRFLSTYGEGTLDGLIEIQVGLRQQGSNESARLIREIIHLVTPLQMPPDFWRPIQDQLQAKHAVLREGAGGLISAEVVAARVAGKGTIFECVRGTLRMPLAVGHPNLHLAPGEPGDRYATFVRGLFEPQSLSKETATLEQMLEYLKTSYGKYLLQHKRSPYLVVELPVNKNNQQAWLRDLKKFKSAVIHVIIIELCKHGKPWAFEAVSSYHLRCLNPDLV
jgi:hypothetical protein